MIESPVYEQILKEGREEALKSGVLAVVEARFEVVPQDIEAGVKAVEGLRQLEIVLKRASVSKDLAEFRDFLRRVKCPVVHSFIRKYKSEKMQATEGHRLNPYLNQ